MTKFNIFYSSNSWHFQIQLIIWNNTVVKVHLLIPLSESEVTDVMRLSVILNSMDLAHYTSVVTHWDPRCFYSHSTLFYLFFLISPSLYTCSSGSHIENWHSVLRNGLVNASYTKLQVRNPGSWLEFTMHLLSDSKPALWQSRLAVRLIHFCS